MLSGEVPADWLAARPWRRAASAALAAAAAVAALSCVGAAAGVTTAAGLAGLNIPPIVCPPPASPEALLQSYQLSSG